MNLNLKGDSRDARRRNPRTDASDYRVLPGESMLHSQTLVDQLGHVALLQGHVPWREVEWQRGLRLPRQRTVSGMTRLSKGHIEGAFEVAEVLGEGSAALGCRLHPCAGFCLKEFLVVLTHPASCSLRRWMVRLPPVSALIRMPSLGRWTLERAGVAEGPGNLRRSLPPGGTFDRGPTPCAAGRRRQEQ